MGIVFKFMNNVRVFSRLDSEETVDFLDSTRESGNRLENQFIGVRR